MSAATSHRSASIVLATGRWVLAVACVLVLAFMALAAAAVQPRVAWAGNSYDKCGENLSTEIGGDPSQLYIAKIDPSGTGYMRGWDNSTIQDRPWNFAKEEIVAVNLASGVASIGSCAFDGCTNVGTVYIPSTVERIGNSAFANCPNLKKVFWGGTVEQWGSFVSPSSGKVGTGNEALTSNPNLTICYWGDCSDSASDNVIWEYDSKTQTFTVRGTGEMKDYDSADSRPWDGYCQDIKHLVVRDEVTCIGRDAFAHFTKLQDAKLYLYDNQSQLKTIRAYAFYGCEKLTDVELPPSVATLWNGAFMHCTGLKSAVIPNKDVVIREDGPHPFEDCSEDLVITGYPLESPGEKSLPRYCSDKKILFDAIGGDKGVFSIDLVGSKSGAVADDYLLPAFVQSLVANPKVEAPEGVGTIDLDGNGKIDIAIDYTSPGEWVLTRAATCNVLPRYTFTLSKLQQLQAARDSGTGFYYSSFNIRLNTLALSDASVQIPTQTYTGKALKPTATVTLRGSTLKAGTDYTISFSANKNAGTAKATITAKGSDYTGSKTVSFKIGKAKASAKAKKSTVKVKYAKVKKKSRGVANLTVVCDKGKASYKNVSKGKAKKFKVNVKTGKVTVPKGTKKSIYKVKVKVTVKAGTNYTKLSKAVSFKVKVA